MKKSLFFLLLIISFKIIAQTPITATIPYQGYDESEAFLGEAEFEIFLDNTDGVLDKPIILLDGFDPGDGRNIAEMYSLLDFNGQNMGDILRSEGFDFVLLNFPVYTRVSDNVTVDGGVDYIQRNAMVLAELINQINTQKVGNEELVIIGPSMGGLISRYALSYMEQNSLDHETRLYISWDAPHLGANIPIAMQYFINFVAESQDDQDLRDLINASLNSPAAREMLVDHYLPHLQSGSPFEQDPNILLPVGAENFRDVFQSELDALGFPQEVRNISVTNGSGNGTIIASPNAEIINHTFDVAANTTTEIVLNFTPVSSQINDVTDVVTRFFGIPIPTSSYNAKSESFSFTDGVDGAPGGIADIVDLVGDTTGNPLLEEFVEALNQSEYCFIPTISALAISNENNWYQTPDIGNTHNSEFVAWYTPNNNEPHVTATQNNIDFILPEIRNLVVGVNDFVFDKKYKLKSNPVRENLTILLDNNFNYNEVNISIINITGQQLFNKSYTNLINELRIPIQLQTGIYFLKIDDNQISFSKKFIIIQ